MKVFKLLTILVLGITVLSCSSINFDKKAPFSVISSTYNITKNNSKSIYIKYSAEKNIEFDSIYFQNQRAKAKIENLEDGNYVFAVFPRVIKPDLVLDNNPVKELNNPIPNLEKFPFELKNNEAIISYKIKNSIHYYKISNVLGGEKSLENEN